MATALQRETFVTSREMDFFNHKELVTQTGHDREEWPLVFLKETIDNAIDACEEAGIAPSVEVTADAASITVRDNGPGLPTSTLNASLDFTVRASNREAYVAPDRGAQGNAIKTLLTMPYIIDQEAGKLVIIASGQRHELICRADPITQRPVIHDDTTDCDDEGTTVRIEWAAVLDDGEIAWPFDTDLRPAESRLNAWYPSLRQCAIRLLRGFALFNPHLRLRVTWFGDVVIDVQPTNEEWKKWKPSQPTNALWYEQRHLERLVAAYVARDRERGKSRTVAEFVAEFDGFSSTKKRKAVCDACSVQRKSLEALTTSDGLDTELISTLLSEMKANSKEVKPARLGIIGRDHFTQRLVRFGCDQDQVEYRKLARVENGIPFVIETAFGWLGEDAPSVRHLFTGANWSSGIKNPFRSFGSTGAGLESQLAELSIGVDEPVIFAMHLAHPRIEYTDRGKSAITIESDGSESKDMKEDWS